jgi:hypothetical protein
MHLLYFVWFCIALVQFASASLTVDNCAVCKSLATLVEDFIKSNKTESEVVAGVEKVCAVLPGDLASQCKSIVDQYLPSIVLIILNGETPEKVCQIFKLCPATQVQPQVESRVDNCAICKTIANYVEDFIKSNKTESEIIAEVEKICAALPSGLAGQCKSFADQYLPSIIVFILNNENPEKVCQLFKLCPAFQIRNSIKETCFTCRTVAGLVESLLKDNKTQAEIEESLDKFCNVLPGGIIDECKALINNNLNNIIAFILVKETPEVICKALGLC